MPAPVVRADYDRLTESARGFSEQSALIRQTLQAISRQTDTLEGGDWLGQGAQAFYAEMQGQVLPTLNRLIRALEAAADTTHQINQVAQQAEAEAAAFFRLAGASNGAGAALSDAAAGLGANGTGGAPASAAAKPANGAAFIGAKAAPGVTGPRRLGATGSELGQQNFDNTLADLQSENPKLAQAIGQDPALSALLERAVRAGFSVMPALGLDPGLSLQTAVLRIGPNTTVAEFKGMAQTAIDNPRALSNLPPKLAQVIKQDKVLLERLLHMRERLPQFTLTANDTPGNSQSRIGVASALIQLDPKNPRGSLSSALTKLERDNARQFPIDEAYPNQRDVFIKRNLEYRLRNDANEIFHALRAEQVALGKMSTNLPHLGKTGNAGSYHMVIEGYMRGSADEMGARDLIVDMLKVEPALIKKRAEYEAHYARLWAEHDARVKASAKQPAQKTP